MAIHCTKVLGVGAHRLSKSSLRLAVVRTEFLYCSVMERGTWKGLDFRVSWFSMIFLKLKGPGFCRFNMSLVCLQSRVSGVSRSAWPASAPRPSCRRKGVVVAHIDPAGLEGLRSILVTQRWSLERWSPTAWRWTRSSLSRLLLLLLFCRREREKRFV